MQLSQTLPFLWVGMSMLMEPDQSIRSWAADHLCRNYFVPDHWQLTVCVETICHHCSRTPVVTLDTHSLAVKYMYTHSNVLLQCWEIRMCWSAATGIPHLTSGVIGNTRHAAQNLLHFLCVLIIGLITYPQSCKECSRSSEVKSGNTMLHLISINSDSLL